MNSLPSSFCLSAWHRHLSNILWSYYATSPRQQGYADERPRCFCSWSLGRVGRRETQNGSSGHSTSVSIAEWRCVYRSEALGNQTMLPPIKSRSRILQKALFFPSRRNWRGCTHRTVARRDTRKNFPPAIWFSRWSQKRQILPIWWVYYLPFVKKSLWALMSCRGKCM